MYFHFACLLTRITLGRMAGSSSGQALLFIKLDNVASTMVHEYFVSWLAKSLSDAFVGAAWK